MNVYDFDGTIYRGDCTLDFWRYCLVRRPVILGAFPGALGAALRFRLQRCSREDFKAAFYRFIPYLPDTGAYAAAFWDSRMSRIQPWYLRQRRQDDLIISASPDFLIAVACKRLGVRWLASLVDGRTGRLLSANCRGEEKVRRFQEAYPGAVVEQFYSDSDSDAPLAGLARYAYRIRGGRPVLWEGG